jgi:uncharacterized OB-fold protein
VTSQRPVPVPDELSAPYWSAAADHVLVLARCSRCRQLTHPPDVVCPECQDPDPAFTFEPVNGGGVIRSWIVLRQSFLPGFQDQLPLVLVDVALDAAAEIRLIGRLLDGNEASFTIGRRVQVAFEDLAPGVSVPAFALEGG